MRQPGMMHAMRHIKMVLLLQRMVQIYWHCLRKNLKVAQGMNFILRDGCNMLKMAGRKKMIWYSHIPAVAVLLLGDLVYLIYEHDSSLCLLHIIVGGGEKL